MTYHHRRRRVVRYTSRTRWPSQHPSVPDLVLSARQVIVPPAALSPSPPARSALRVKDAMADPIPFVPELSLLA
jgi:hypothetical protein